jgi:hypothetical protein
MALLLFRKQRQYSTLDERRQTALLLPNGSRRVSQSGVGHKARSPTKTRILAKLRLDHLSDHLVLGVLTMRVHQFEQMRMNAWQPVGRLQQTSADCDALCKWSSDSRSGADHQTQALQCDLREQSLRITRLGAGQPEPLQWVASFVGRQRVFNKSAYRGSRVPKHAEVAKESLIASADRHFLPG